MRVSIQRLLRVSRAQAFAAAAAVVGVGGLAPGAAPLHAQQPFIAAIAAEWLQLGSGTLDRDAGPSVTVSAAHEWSNGVRLELGYLRSAHKLTTAEGATAGVGLSLRRGPLTVRPGVAALLGAAQAAGVSGSPEVSRTTAGGALNLGAELRLLPIVSLTGSVRQWFFTSDVLGPDRTTTLFGVGLSLRPAVGR